MFYQEEFDLENLRFGDVIQGFIGTVPVIENPLSDAFIKGYKYEIKSYIYEFSVIMTPCCSIGNNTISLAPLKKITPDITKNLNSDIIKDFIPLNRKIEYRKFIYPKIWNEILTDEQRSEHELDGPQWVYIDIFFYKEHDLFEEYSIKKDNNIYNTRDYRIDFKEIYQLKCNKIQRNKIGVEILKSKCLELTIQTRDELREKIAFYYTRVPKEDET